MFTAFTFVTSAASLHVTTAHGSRAPTKILVAFAPLFFLVALHAEEPASQIRRVGQLSANELSIVREHALQGDADAQVTLGLAYDGGSRVFKQNSTEARRWYEMSAKQGTLDAQFWLLGMDHPAGKNARPSYLELARSGHIGAMNVYASLCVDGSDGPQDFAQAMLWWKKAADAGSGEAAFNVGVMYLEGEGVTADDREAVRWLRRSVDRGSLPAAARLGTMALMEKGGLTPGADCTQWLKIAADAGDPTAMLNLGTVFFHGKGAQPDFLEAYMWFTLAAQRGLIDGRAGVRLKMTKTQIADAEKRAKDWNAKHKPETKAVQ